MKTDRGKSNDNPIPEIGKSRKRDSRSCHPPFVSATCLLEPLSCCAQKWGSKGRPLGMQILTCERYKFFVLRDGPPSLSLSLFAVSSSVKDVGYCRSCLCKVTSLALVAILFILQREFQR